MIFRLIVSISSLPRVSYSAHLFPDKQCMKGTQSVWQKQEKRFYARQKVNRKTNSTRKRGDGGHSSERIMWYIQARNKISISSCLLTINVPSLYHRELSRNRSSWRNPAVILGSCPHSHPVTSRLSSSLQRP